jgi:hypothetical protein
LFEQVFISQYKYHIEKFPDIYVNLGKKHMIIERINDEILVRFKPGKRASQIQTILDYLRYEELTSKSTAKEEDVDRILAS